MWNARYNAPAAHDLIVGDVIDAGITKDGVLLFVMRLNLAEKFHSGPILGPGRSPDDG